MEVANNISNKLPLTQSIIQSYQLVEVPCFTSLPRNDSTPLDFRIDKTAQHIDPSQVYLYLKCEIEPADTLNMPTCANNLAYSMWQNVEMYINDQKVTQDQTLYPWMSYLICLTKYSQLYRKTALTAGLWFPDLYGTMDTAEGDNTGSIERKQAVSGKFELYSRVMTDFIYLPRLLPNQTEVMYRFIPASTGLYMIGKGENKMKITDARLYVTKAKVDIDLAKTLYYPVARYSGRVKTVNVGEQNLDWVPFTGKRPRRIYVTQVLQKTYNGDVAKNPFNLQTFGLKTIQVYFNDLSLPTNTIQTMADDDVVRCYLNTIKAVNSSESWDISLRAYQLGYFVYVVDLTNDHSASESYISAAQHGSIRVVINYKESMTSAIAVMCFAEFDDVLVIDDDGNSKWA